LVGNVNLVGVGQNKFLVVFQNISRRYIQKMITQKRGFSQKNNRSNYCEILNYHQIFYDILLIDEQYLETFNNHTTPWLITESLAKIKTI